MTSQEWPGRPWDAPALRKYMNRVWVGGYRGRSEEPTRGQLVYAISSLAKVSEHDDRKGRTVVLYLWGLESRRDMSAAQCSGIIDWVGATRQNDFQEDPDAVLEGAAIERAWRIEHGQLQFKFPWEE